MSQKPSVGRIVHYNDTLQQGRKIAAIITEVISDERVVLTLFRSGSTPEPLLFGTLRGTDPDTWSWPERV